MEEKAEPLIQHLIDGATFAPTMSLCGEPFEMVCLQGPEYRTCPACELAHHLLLSAMAIQPLPRKSGV